MNRFAVFDIDGTLIRWQLYHAVVDSLSKHSRVDQTAYKVVKDARTKWKQRESRESFKNYEDQLVDFYNSSVTNLKVKDFDQAVADVFDEHKDQVYRYTRDLIKDLKKQGYTILAVSSSQTEIVAKVANYYSFDDYIGTVFEQKDGKFTGQIDSPFASKDVALKTLVKKHGLDFKDSYGVGDSKSDIKMLSLVDNPIAFNPEQSLFDHAKANGWKVVVERKNIVYELQRKGGKYELAKAD